jgi:hypothetical protein
LRAVSAGQCDVGGDGVVAGANGGIAEHPVADGQLRRIRSNGADAADAARAGDHGQIERVVAFAAEDLVEIGQHAGGNDIDDDLAGAKHGSGNILDDER